MQRGLLAGIIRPDQYLCRLQVLCQIKGLSEAKIEKMLEAAHKMVPAMGWQSARAYDQLVRRTTCLDIPTGCTPCWQSKAQQHRDRCRA